MAYPNLDFWRHIHGHFDFQEVYDLLAAAARPDETLVEVGCLLGKSACYLAQRLPARCRLLCVDTWPEIYVSEGGVEIEAPYSIFLANTLQCGISYRIHPVRMTSVEAAGLVDDASCASVFIDASHEEKDVRDDILAWRPKIRPQGYLGGHDYGSTYPGVKRAVDDLVKRPEIIGQSWLVQI